MVLMQSPTKTIPFYLPLNYKTLWPNRKWNEQYWKEIAVEFIKQKHNVDTTRQEFLIEIYTGGLPYESYFIALML